MTATKCTNVLEQEHQTIPKAVAAMSVAADQLDAVRTIDPSLLRDFSSFLHDFAEERHHTREERFHFPLLEARGVPRRIAY